jgi:anti-anti-sigma regulatory factor
MAKIRHRVFEIYESAEEATRELTPKRMKTATDSSPLESWTFKHLVVSRSAGVTHVRFTKPSEFNEAAIAELRDDFAQLADSLGMDSKVLADFTGVVSFDPGFIDALVLFSRKLRTRGSRIVLCCLAPSVHALFFARDDRDSRGDSL